MVEKLLGVSVLILVYVEEQGSPQKEMSFLVHRRSLQDRYKFRLEGAN